MQNKTSLSFEQKLEQLEELVVKMEEGGLQLDELMKAYAQGTTLAQALNRELDSAQQQMLKLRGTALEPMAEDGL